MLYRSRHEPKGKVWYFPFWGALSIFHLSDKLQDASLCTHTNKLNVIWTCWESPLQTHILGFVSLKLGAPWLLCGWSHQSEAQPLMHNHLLIIIHACHVCHLHALTTRMRAEGKYERGHRSVPGILIISPTGFWRSVFLYAFSLVSSYLSLSQFVLRAKQTFGAVACFSHKLCCLMGFY